jgi:hypothetical protein
MKQDDLIRRLGSGADSAERAARELYAAADVEQLMTDSDLTAALRACVSDETHCTAGVLLLGYDSSTASLELLHRLREQSGAESAKLNPWDPIVPLALPVDVALSRLGDAGARSRLLEQAERGSLETKLFLLGVLRDVDAPEVLQALAPTLDDERQVPGGVPSGADPARRLTDTAVDAFIRRLGLSVDFDANGARRYSAAEAGQVKRLLEGSVPR